MVGLAFEYGVRFSGAQRPVAVFDFGFELAGGPAGVAEEDTQAVHRFVAAEEGQQQFVVGAHPDVGKCPDGVLGRLGRAKQEPDRVQFNRSAEEEFVVHLCEALQAWKELRDLDLGGPVHDHADRGGAQVVHDEDHGISEVRIGQLAPGGQEECSQMR